MRICQIRVFETRNRRKATARRADGDVRPRFSCIWAYRPCLRLCWLGHGGVRVVAGRGRDVKDAEKIFKYVRYSDRIRVFGRVFPNTARISRHWTLSGSDTRLATTCTTSTRNRYQTLQLGWGLRELGRGARWGWGREVREVREGLGSAGWIACLYSLHSTNSSLSHRRARVRLPQTLARAQPAVSPS